MTENFYDSRAWLELRYQRLKISGGHCMACGVRATEENPIHVDHIKPRSTHLSDLQRQVRRELLERSIKGSTKEERQAARKLLDSIAAFAADSFASRKQAAGDEQ